MEKICIRNKYKISDPNFYSYGKRIIDYLISIGGNNKHNWTGVNSMDYYYICNDGIIMYNDKRPKRYTPIDLDDLDDLNHKEEVIDDIRDCFIEIINMLNLKK